MKDQIKALRAKAENANARMSEILAASQAAGNASLTADEQAAFDAASADYDAAMKAIVPWQQAVERAAAVEAVQIPAEPAPARDATGVLRTITTGGNSTPAPGATVQRASAPATVKDPDDWKRMIAACAWAAAKAKASPRFTPLEHLDAAGCQQVADQSRAADAAIKRSMLEMVSGLGGSGGQELIGRALTSLSGGGGDNAITTPMSTEFIEFLRNQSAFMRGGPRIVDMPLGSLVIPGGLAGATGTYHAEGADFGYTQATTRKVSLAAKHISAVTAMQNYLLDISPVNLEPIIGEDLAMGIALAIDAAGLRGDGTGSNPTGILSLVNASNKAACSVATTTTPTYANIDAEVKAMLTLMDIGLTPSLRRSWTMASRTFRYLQFMRDGNGNYVYPGLQLANPVWYDNKPVIVSEQTPTNLGVGTNEGELYFNDYGHVLMGVTRALRLMASQEASYKDGGGTMISAFARDQTVIRGTASHDFDARHDKAMVIRTAVKWGG